MAIKIYCPQCGQVMQVKEEHIGKKVRCPQPSCNFRFRAQPPPPEDPEPDPMFPGMPGDDEQHNDADSVRRNSQLDALAAVFGGGVGGEAPPPFPARMPEPTDMVGQQEPEPAPLPMPSPSGRAGGGFPGVGRGGPVTPPAPPPAASTDAPSVRLVRPKPSLKPETPPPSPEESQARIRPVAPRPRLVSSEPPPPVPPPAPLPVPSPAPSMSRGRPSGPPTGGAQIGSPSPAPTTRPRPMGGSPAGPSAFVPPAAPAPMTGRAGHRFDDIAAALDGNRGGPPAGGILHVGPGEVTDEQPRDMDMDAPEDGVEDEAPELSDLAAAVGRRGGPSAGPPVAPPPAPSRSPKPAQPTSPPAPAGRGFVPPPASPPGAQQLKPPADNSPGHGQPGGFGPQPVVAERPIFTPPKFVAPQADELPEEIAEEVDQPTAPAVAPPVPHPALSARGQPRPPAPVAPPPPVATTPASAAAEGGRKLQEVFESLTGTRAPRPPAPQASTSAELPLPTTKPPVPPPAVPVIPNAPTIPDLGSPSSESAPNKAEHAPVATAIPAAPAVPVATPVATPMGGPMAPPIAAAVAATPAILDKPDHPPVPGLNNPLGQMGFRIPGPPPVPTRLEGAEVFLRPLRFEDAAACARWFEDAHALRTSVAVRALAAVRDSPTPAKSESKSDSGEIVRPIGCNDGGLSLAICIRENQQLIGVTGLYDFDWRNRTARLEFLIGDGQVSGKGFRSDAARTMVDYGFRELNLHRQYLLLPDNHTRGRKVFQLVGFAEEGKLRQSYWADGRYWDVTVLGLLSEAYFEILRREAAEALASAAATGQSPPAPIAGAVLVGGPA